MSDETFQVQPAPTVNFAILSADNAAAIHLLDLVKAETPLPALISNKTSIGYQLSTISSCNGSGLKDFWLIGAGPSQAIHDKNYNNTKPDILLCPPGESRSANRARQCIEDIHAVIDFHTKSNVLMLTTNSKRLPIIYENGDMGNQDLKLYMLERKSCVMRQKRNFLRIGEYRFVLEFITQGHCNDGEKAKIESHGYRSLYPTPSAYPAHSEASWNVWLHNYIPETSVRSGVNIYTGDPVAVKQLPRNIASQPDTRARLRTASQYGKTLENGVLGILDTWCKHNISPPCFCAKEKKTFNACHKMFYSMPLAKHSFANMQWSRIYEDRSMLCYQTLMGLAELHAQNISHGNIRPDSLLIFDEPELSIPTKDIRNFRAVISLDMQLPEKPNASICIAPEIWKEDGANLDKEKLDIWGIAASWLFAFFQVPKERKMDRKLHLLLIETIDAGIERGYYKKAFAQLLHKMLALKPQDRPSATMALAYDAWQTVRNREAYNGRLKRKPFTPNANTRSKRVRWDKLECQSDCKALTPKGEK